VQRHFLVRWNGWQPHLRRHGNAFPVRCPSALTTIPGIRQRKVIIKGYNDFGYTPVILSA
ncbi:MAG: hypothetical protein UHH87_05330, partial [Akkermansia sp.]|nr:hypothetical protein [Akkermansia sp.]